MEEFLSLQEKAARLEKELAQVQAENAEKANKILELTEKINAIMNESMKNASDVRHFRSMTSVLETDKKNLERERDRLLKENEALSSQAKQLASMVETVNKTLQTKEDSLLSKEKQLQKKDELLTEKDAKIEEYRQHFTKLSEEKEKYQQEKFTFMESLNKEKLELVEKAGNLEKTLQAEQAKATKYKDKARAAEDGLLGSSMEIEKLNETNAKLNQKCEELTKELENIKGRTGAAPATSTGPSPEIQKAQEEQVQQYKQKIAELEAHLEDTKKKLEETKAAANKPQIKPPEEEDVFGKGTGVYKSISALIAHFKLKIGAVQRTLRLIVPEIGDIKKHNLIEALDNLSPQILKNIATAVELPADNPALEELKSKNFKITDYKGRNIFALQIDNNDAALAIFEKTNNTITGVYSNHEELVKLLSQAIMNPYIRGSKLN